MNRKVVLLGFMLFFATLSLTLPCSLAYGSSFVSAEEIAPGTYDLILSMGDDNAYYKINCSENQKIHVKITFNSSCDLDLFLYGPSYGPLASSESPYSAEAVTYLCTVTGTYYFQIYRYAGSGDLQFTLIVQLGTSGGFSLYSWWVIVIAVVFCGLIALVLRFGLRNRVKLEVIE